MYHLKMKNYSIINEVRYKVEPLSENVVVVSTIPKCHRTNHQWFNM